MSHPDDAGPEVTAGGSTIYRHAEPTAWAPPAEELALEAVSAHIERHLGPVTRVFHEIVSDTVHLDVHIVGPSADLPFVRLVTSGMSDLPMATPDDEVPRHAELMVTLPADWRLDEADLQDERWYWPVRLLKTLARLPHKHATWLGWGHTIPHGDPPAPYAPGTALCGAIILPSLLTDPAFHLLEGADGRRTAFYSVIPLHEDEMELKLREGTDALLERFDRRRVTDVIDPARRSVMRRRFLWW